MSDKNNHHENHVNLNLSLRFPQQQEPVEQEGQRQGQFMQPLTSSNPPHHQIIQPLSLWFPQQQDLVDQECQGQGQFVQPLTSSDPPQNIHPSPLPPHHMTSFEDFTNGTNPWIVPAQDLPLFPPPPSVSEEVSLPYQPSGQALHPLQLNQAGTVPLETPRGGQLREGQASHLSTRAIICKPPYPWATTKPAVIHTIRYLSFNNINVISGQVQCRPCNKTQTLKYNLMEKFSELHAYIKDNKEGMRHRAPPMWLNPELIPCGTCQSEMKPVISKMKEEINWLFLLLGQMLGCCTLEQLRFFCEANSQHRTGAKDRVLYITYLGLCRQLDPEGPFSLSG